MVNRYNDLLSVLPIGRPYKADGEILPFTDAAHEFEISTAKSATRLSVYLNDVFSGNITTDSEGTAIVTTIAGLPPGEYDLRLVDPRDNQSTRRFFTIKNIATLFAGLAEVLEDMHADVQDISDAKALSTVGGNYIQDAYGRALRQPLPSTFLLEEYRKMLQQLRPAYRHFGAHPYGLSQAVQTFTSVDPFIVPKEWRPRWKYGESIVPNGKLEERTRISTNQFAPAGSDSPLDEFPDLNRQSRYYIHPAVTGAITSANALWRQPPHPQYLTVTVGDTNTVILEGIDASGESVTEEVPDPSLGSVTGTYRTFYRYQRLDTTTKASGTAAQIGLGEDRFLTLSDISDFYVPGTSSTIAYRGYTDLDRPEFRVGTGDWRSLAVDADPQVLKLREASTTAFLVGRRERNATTYNMNPLSSTSSDYHDYLWFDMDGFGVIGCNIGNGATTVSIANTVSRTNTAFNADTRYGTSYNDVASALVGTVGSNLNTVIMIESQRPHSATALSQVKLVAGPSDAAYEVFGLPLTTTKTDAAVSGNVVSCVSTSQLPSVSSTDETDVRQYDIRIRGLRNGVAAGELFGVFLRRTIDVEITGYTFTSEDIGGWVRWVDDNTANNNGIHPIIALSATPGRATIMHQFANVANTYIFASSSPTTGDGSVYGTGEICAVINNDTGANELTVDDVAYLWPAGAYVELVSGAPYTVTGGRSLREIELEIDTSFRPRHDFGDSLAYGSGIVTLTCTRGLFTGLVGEVITISNAVNLENDGEFTLIAVTSTTAQWINSLGVSETSQFEWSINTFLSDIIDDTFDVLGPVMPDGWTVEPFDTSVVNTVESAGVSSRSRSGLLARSRLLLTSDEDVQISRSVPEALAYKGLPLNITFWVQEHAEDNVEYTIAVQFNDVDGFHDLTVYDDELSTVLRLATQRGPLTPFPITRQFWVPYDADEVTIRLTRTNVSGDETFSFEKCVLSCPTSTGLCIGDNTVLRSQKRSKFGELVYVWSAETLEDEEREFLGLAVPSEVEDGASASISGSHGPGHIDYVTNAHGYWDRLDVSEIDDSTSPPVRINIQGAYNEGEWNSIDTATQLEHLEVIAGTPSRVTYVRPTRLSAVSLESLEMIDGGDGPGFARADLDELSNHEGDSGGLFPQAPNTEGGTGARLYEVTTSDRSITLQNGLVSVIPAGSRIPLPDTEDDDSVQPWEFTSQSQIRINSPYYESTSTYVLDYDVMMRATTEAIEAEAGGIAREDYVWLVDFAAYKRHNIGVIEEEMTEQAVFVSDFTAKLSLRANTLETATLEEDTGLAVRTISQLNWSFVDARTVRIEGSEFNPNAIYSITYMGKSPNISSTVEYELEWRYSDNIGDLDDAEWITVTPNQIITPVITGADDIDANIVPAWHQLRVTITGVEDVRDARVFGIGIKGVALSRLGIE